MQALVTILRSNKSSHANVPNIPKSNHASVISKLKVCNFEEKHNFLYLIDYLTIALRLPHNKLTHGSELFSIHSENDKKIYKYYLTKEGILKYLQKWVNEDLNNNDVETLVKACAPSKTKSSFFCGYTDALIEILEQSNIKCSPASRLTEIADMLNKNKLGSNIENVSVACTKDHFPPLNIELVSYISQFHDERPGDFRFPLLTREQDLTMVDFEITSQNFAKTSKYLTTSYCRIKKLSSKVALNETSIRLLIPSMMRNTSLKELDILCCKKDDIKMRVALLSLARPDLKIELKLSADAKGTLIYNITARTANNTRALNLWQSPLTNLDIQTIKNFIAINTYNASHQHLYFEMDDEKFSNLMLEIKDLQEEYSGLAFIPGERSDPKDGTPIKDFHSLKINYLDEENKDTNFFMLEWSKAYNDKFATVQELESNAEFVEQSLRFETSNIKELLPELASLIIMRSDLQFHVKTIASSSEKLSLDISASKNKINQLFFDELVLTEKSSIEILVNHLQDPECKTESLICESKLSNNSLLNGIAGNKSLTEITLVFKTKPSSEELNKVEIARPDLKFELKIKEKGLYTLTATKNDMTQDVIKTLTLTGSIEKYTVEIAKSIIKYPKFKFDVKQLPKNSWLDETKYTLTITENDVAEELYISVIDDKSAKLLAEHLSSSECTAKTLSCASPLKIEWGILESITDNTTLENININIAIETDNINELQSKLTNWVIQHPDSRLHLKVEGEEKFVPEAIVALSRFFITITKNKVPNQLYIQKGIVANNDKLEVLVKRLQDPACEIASLICESKLSNNSILNGIAENRSLTEINLVFKTQPSSKELNKVEIARLDLTFKLETNEKGLYILTAAKNGMTQEVNKTLTLTGSIEKYTVEIVKSIIKYPKFKFDVKLQPKSSWLEETKYALTITENDVADELYISVIDDKSAKLLAEHLRSPECTAKILYCASPLKNAWSILESIADNTTLENIDITIETGNINELRSKLTNLIVQRPDLHFAVSDNGAEQTKFVITTTKKHVTDELYFAKDVLTSSNIKILVKHLETEGCTVKRLISHSFLTDDGNIVESLAKNNQLEYIELYFNTLDTKDYGEKLVLNVVNFIIARPDFKCELNYAKDVNGKPIFNYYKFTVTKKVNTKELFLGNLELTDAVTSELVKYLAAPQCEAQTLNCNSWVKNFDIFDAIAANKSLTYIEPLYFEVTSKNQLKILKTKVEALKKTQPGFDFELKQYEDANGNKDTSRYVLKQMAREMKTFSDKSGIENNAN